MTTHPSTATVFHIFSFTKKYKLHDLQFLFTPCGSSGMCVCCGAGVLKIPICFLQAHGALSAT